MTITDFKELQIWKESLLITKIIYDLSATEKFSKDFGLRDQIRRAVVSISSNIVEGFEKNNNNEFVRFLKIAKGSLGEVRNQLEIAYVVKYISKEELVVLDKKLIDLGNQIGGFIKYLQSKKKLAIRNT